MSFNNMMLGRRGSTTTSASAAKADSIAGRSRKACLTLEAAFLQCVSLCMILLILTSAVLYLLGMALGAFLKKTAARFW